MRDAEITLIKETPQKDEYGVYRTVETETSVMCQCGSVTRAEFFGGGRNGLNPELVVTVFGGDYDGERKCAFEGKNYAIYRTYQPEGDDYIELYLQREGGTNG